MVASLTLFNRYADMDSSAVYGIAPLEMMPIGRACLELCFTRSPSLRALKLVGAIVHGGQFRRTRVGKVGKGRNAR